MNNFLKSYTFLIGVICVVVLILQKTVVGFDYAFVLMDDRLWRLDTWITCIFMHGNVVHLVSNMVGVLTIGYYLEKIMGKNKYLKLYWLSGIAGSALQMAYYILIDEQCGIIGASGALCGIVGAVAYYRPTTRLLLFFIIPMRVVHLYWFFLVFEIVNAIINRGTGNVAHLAHVGGLISGFLLAKFIHKQLVIYIEGTNYQGESFTGKAYSVSAVQEFLTKCPFNFYWKHVSGRQLTDLEFNTIDIMAKSVKNLMSKSSEELEEITKRLEKELESLKRENNS